MLDQVWTDKIFDSESVSNNSSAESVEIPLYLAHGNCSLQIEVTGAGTLDFEYELKNSLTNDYVIPSSGAAIITGITSSSGSNNDGKDHVEFNVGSAIKMKIKATETGGTDPATVTAWIAVL